MYYTALRDGPGLPPRPVHQHRPGNVSRRMDVHAARGWGPAQARPGQSSRGLLLLQARDLRQGLTLRALVQHRGGKVPAALCREPRRDSLRHRPERGRRRVGVGMGRRHDGIPVHSRAARPGPAVLLRRHLRRNRGGRAAEVSLAQATLVARSPRGNSPGAAATRTGQG